MFIQTPSSTIQLLNLFSGLLSVLIASWRCGGPLLHHLQLDLQHLEEVLQLLKRQQWQVKLSKCTFAQQQVDYLGHVISGQGVATDPSKIDTIQSWPVPISVKEVRGFLGLDGYYRKFIRLFGVINRPLTNLLKKGGDLSLDKH